VSIFFLHIVISFQFSLPLQSNAIGCSLLPSVHSFNQIIRTVCKRQQQSRFISACYSADQMLFL